MTKQIAKRLLAVAAIQTGFRFPPYFPWRRCGRPRSSRKTGLANSSGRHFAEASYGVRTVRECIAFHPFVEDKIWEQNRNNKPQTPPKTVLRDIGKGRRINHIVFLGLFLRAGGRRFEPCHVHQLVSLQKS